MKSAIVKRSVVIARHNTSVSLEEPFWSALKKIARSRGMSLPDLIDGIDCDRHEGNLSSALQVFVLGVYREAVVSDSGARKPYN
jgi:predicted DNA-binding ribbon-helix-helix protein